MIEIIEVTIRKAIPEDAEEISKIWTVICAEKIFSAVSHPFTREQEKDYIISLSDREGIFVAEKEGKIIGFQSLDKWARYSDSFDHVGVIGTFILPQWRKKKIGTKLAEYSFNFARNNNYEKIVIYVRATNTGAIDFYKKLGFIQKGILSRQVKINTQYEDEIFMELFL
ncbi:MAG: GNAT family N-acetyltransferase [Promethearchaeota archaeon]|nr:MAG: GNAT family N-acetyltransferase [Candidatus Lokiarchaeota archaeon]